LSCPWGLESTVCIHNKRRRVYYLALRECSLIKRSSGSHFFCCRFHIFYREYKKTDTSQLWT
jgi:hypothetical protein